MKRRYFYLFPVFVPLLCAVAVLAYKPGPDSIRECPKCKAALEQSTMMSGNSLDARYWTDGKMEAPMLPDRPWLVKCPKCSNLFWMTEAKKLGEQYKYDKDKDKKWPDAVEPGLPAETDFLTMLGTPGLSEKKEQYLRIRAWWAANDIKRKNRNMTDDWSLIQKANLESLADLLDATDSDQRIMKAEIFRELKRFDDCINLLAQPFEKEDHHAFAVFIRRLAEDRFWMVEQIE